MSRDQSISLSDDICGILNLPDELLAKIILFSIDKSHFLKEVISLERVNKRFRRIAQSTIIWKDQSNLDIVIDSNKELVWEGWLEIDDKIIPCSFNGEDYPMRNYTAVFGAFLKRVVSVKSFSVDWYGGHNKRCKETIRRCANKIWVKRNLCSRLFSRLDEHSHMRDKFKLSEITLTLPNRVMAQFVRVLRRLNLLNVRTLAICTSKLSKSNNVVWPLINDCRSLNELKICQYGLDEMSWSKVNKYPINISKLKGCWKELTSLSLENRASISDWNKILECYPNLRSLELTGRKLVKGFFETIMERRQIHSFTPDLEHLGFYSCHLDWLYSHSIPSIISLFPKLNSLNVKQCGPYVFNEPICLMINSIVNDMVNLNRHETFKLEMNMRDKDELINEIGHQFDRIRENEDESIEMTKQNVTIVIVDRGLYVIGN